LVAMVVNAEINQQFPLAPCITSAVAPSTKNRGFSAKISPTLWTSEGV
jgi:hypothetical protein